MFCIPVHKNLNEICPRVNFSVGQSHELCWPVFRIGIRIQSGQWIRIRNPDRIQEGKNDP